MRWQRIVTPSPAEARPDQMPNTCFLILCFLFGFGLVLVLCCFLVLLTKKLCALVFAPDYN